MRIMVNTFFLREINFHAYAVQFACSRCHLTGIIFTSNGNMRDDDDATGNSYATAAAAIRVFGFILVPFHYHDEFNYYQHAEETEEKMSCTIAT